MSLRIVVVTYNWPPRNAIGTHRPYSWAKYWSRDGHHVTVITAKKQPYDQPLDLVLPVLPGVEVIEAESGAPAVGKVVNFGGSAWDKNLAWIKRIKRAFESRLGVVWDARDGWAKGARPHALRLAEVSDVVVSTFGPRSSHLIARQMKERNPALLWVADYRDLWSQNHLMGYSVHSARSEARSECEVVGRADLLTVVSDELAEKLRKFLKKPTFVVHNGFDTDDEVAPAGAGRHVKTIVYTGILYKGTRDPSPLFAAMELLREEGRLRPSDLIVEFYGPPADWLAGLASRYGVGDMVSIKGRVKREVALRCQREADRLLLLESGEDDAKGVLTGKVFEYLAANRPIVSLGSARNSSIGRLLGECRSGICLGLEVAAVKAMLEGLLFSDRDPEWFNPDRDNISKYTREGQARHLMDLIQSVRDGRTSAVGEGSM